MLLNFHALRNIHVEKFKYLLSHGTEGNVPTIFRISRILQLEIIAKAACTRLYAVTTLSINAF